MFRRFLNLFRPDQLEDEIREELEYHRSRTSGPFGHFTSIQDQTRAASTIVWLETLVADVRYGLRQLARTPAITAVAVLSLALGIGANTAIFSLIDAVLLRSLPVRDPARLVLFNDGISTGVYSGGRDLPADYFSYSAWEYFRDHNVAFEGLCAFRLETDGLALRLAGTRVPEQATGHLVSGSYFSVLGVEAAAGRMLTAADDRLAAPNVAVISDRFWQHQFHGDRKAIGAAVELNGAMYTIVGVAPREFFGERVSTPPDFWLPLSRQPQITRSESWLASQDVFWLNLMGRLKPGVTARQAEAAVNVQFRQFYLALEGVHPTAERLRKIQQTHVSLRPGGRGISWARYRYSQPLHVLMAMVGLVLLIACVNIMTLLLARASARMRELFVRRALGCSRRRLIRQLLTESVLLATVGGAAGILLAWWSVKVLEASFGLGNNSVLQVRPNMWVLCFTLGLSILTGIGFGLLPALRASAIELRSGAEARSAASPRFPAGPVLVVLQVALSSVLLVGAGLLTHSLITLEHQDLGFRADNVLVVRTDPRTTGYARAELFPLYRQIQERMNSLAGVQSASMARYTPLSGSSSSGNFSLQGYESPAGREMNVYGVEVGPGFFQTLGIPILAGRAIDPRDVPTAPAVAVVSQAFVDEFLPGQNPIGRRLSLGAPFREPGMEIIGVAADTKYYGLREKPKPMAYFAAWQNAGRVAYVGEIIVRTSGAFAGVASEVRRALNEIDSRLPVLKVSNLSEQVYDATRQERLMSRFCSFFGLLALLLAAIGIYGTTAYSVERRTREIGVRIALGAERRQVRWMVLRDSLRWVLLGLVCGAPLAWAATRSVRSFLFGIPPADPIGIGAAVVLLAAVSTLAGYLPASRATRVDPLAALRWE